MATASIDNTLRAGDRASSRKNRLRVQPYSLACTGGAFLAAELVMVAVLWSAWGPHILGALILVGSCALFYHLNDLDRSLATASSSKFWVELVESLSQGLLASVLLFRWFPGLLPRASNGLAAAVLICLLPVFLRYFLRHLVTQGRCVEEVLIVGTGDLASKLYRALGSDTGCLGNNRQMVSISGILPERGGAVDFAQLNELLAGNRISQVVIAELDSQSREELAGALLDSRLRGLQVCDAVDFYERFSGKIWVEGLNSQWFVYTNGFNRSQTTLLLKRVSDVAFASLLLLLTSPLLALIAVAIRLDSPGPIFFRQVRVGLHGKTFVIYKFRSMRHDAEREGGPVWASEQDERVTRVGRLLRMFRFDEIPQAINVLKGDMSVVGPRPERPCFVDSLKREIPFYNLRHYLKPGISGWAQVMYPYGASVEDAYEKLQYDLYYVKHGSLRRDFVILLRTVRIVLFGRGR